MRGKCIFFVFHVSARVFGHEEAMGVYSAVCLVGVFAFGLGTGFVMACEVTGHCPTMYSTVKMN